ncbi:hypothetical protein VP01_444g4 [Puccinia sorghi]|uniref:Uncharacterized protein n=1 Tax=Puccinia sorghi TaxID=27349 RepID=A0A0L6UQ94_9BASI|nr:hypothetical protein VP01_444g4 [Puccinia sorghi]
MYTLPAGSQWRTPAPDLQAPYYNLNTLLYAPPAGWSSHQQVPEFDLMGLNLVCLLSKRDSNVSRCLLVHNILGQATPQCKLIKDKHKVQARLRIISCIVLPILLADLKGHWNELYEEDEPDSAPVVVDNIFKSNEGIHSILHPITLSHFEESQ